MNNANTPGDDQRRVPGQNRDAARMTRNTPRQNRDGPPANQENQDQYQDAPRPFRAVYRANRDSPVQHQVAPRNFRNVQRLNREAQDQNRELPEQRRAALGHRRGVPGPNPDPIQGPPDNRIIEPMFTMPFPFHTERDGEAVCPPRPGIPSRPGVLSTRRSRVLTSEETFFSMVRSNHLNLNNPMSYPETSDRADDRRLEIPSTSRVSSMGRASPSIPSIREDDPTVLDRMIESFDKLTMRNKLGSSVCKIKSGNNQWGLDAPATSSFTRHSSEHLQQNVQSSQDNFSEFSAASVSGITIADSEIADSSSEDARHTRQSKTDKDNEDESESQPDSASTDRDDISTSSNAVDGSCNTGDRDVYSYVQAQVVNYVYSNSFDASSNAALGADASSTRDSSVLGLPARNRGRRPNMRNARLSNSGQEHVQYAECYLDDDILDW